MLEQDAHSDEQIRKILGLKRVAVVGISRHPSKAAHYVPKYLSDNGYQITPVNPAAGQILERRCYSDISEVDNVDIVEIFRPSDQVMHIVRQAIKKRPKVIWLQEGIHNPEAEELARSHGIQIVYNRCMLAEHKRLVA